MINLLAQALHADTLDDALSPIMTALGIETGDIAAQVFSGFSGLPKGDDFWLGLTEIERRRWIGEWLAVETLNAE